MLFYNYAADGYCVWQVCDLFEDMESNLQARQEELFENINKHLEVRLQNFMNLFVMLCLSFLVQ